MVVHKKINTMCYLAIPIVVTINLVIVNGDVQPAARNASVDPRLNCPDCVKRKPRGSDQDWLSRNATALLKVFERREKFLHETQEWYEAMDVSRNVTRDFTKLLNVNAFGMTVSMVAIGYESSRLPHLNPAKCDFYTNAYRWSINFLRTMQRSILEGTPYAVHQRFLKESRFINTLLVPKHLRVFLPWIKGAEWAREERTLKKYLDALRDRDLNAAG